MGSRSSACLTAACSAAGAFSFTAHLLSSSHAACLFSGYLSNATHLSNRLQASPPRFCLSIALITFSSSSNSASIAAKWHALVAVCTLNHCCMIPEISSSLSMAVPTDNRIDLTGKAKYPPFASIMSWAASIAVLLLPSLSACAFVIVSISMAAF